IYPFKDIKELNPSFLVHGLSAHYSLDVLSKGFLLLRKVVQVSNYFVPKSLNGLIVLLNGQGKFLKGILQLVQFPVDQLLLKGHPDLFAFQFCILKADLVLGSVNRLDDDQKEKNDPASPKEKYEVDLLSLHLCIFN